MFVLACLLSVISLPALVAASARVVGVSKVLAGASSQASGNGTLNISVAPNNTWIFDPPNVNAAIGQTINFHFPNDPPVSVTQSAPEAPCTFLELSNGTVGFDTQLQSSVVFTLEILDNEPIYFHCKHPGHCGMGMVGTINAPASGIGSFDSFQTAALQLGQNAPNDSLTGKPSSGNSGLASPLGLPNSAEPTMGLGAQLWPICAALAFAALSFVTN